MNRFISKTLTVALLGVVSFELTGCVTLFAPARQTVAINCATPGAKIKTEENTNGSTGNVKTRVTKTEYMQGATAEKEGFKTRHYGYELTKMSPYATFAVLDVVTIVGLAWLGLDLMSPKAQMYDKQQTIPALLPYEMRKENEKFMLIHNTALDVKAGDISYKYYGSIKSYTSKNTDAAKAKEAKKKKRNNKPSSDAEDIKIDNTVFTEALNGTLKEMNFIDTTNTIFPNYGNTLYIDGTIKKVRVHVITSVGSGLIYDGTNALMSVELDIDWNILDYYKQPIQSVHTKRTSDLILITNAKEISKRLVEATTDNLEYALMDIRKELNSKGTLAINKDAKSEAMEMLSLSRPALIENARMNDFLKSGVTVKVDEGHGSGIVVSDNGYIVTNFHVIAGSKKVEVILNDGTKVEAEVIRKNTDADLALIKINKTGLTPLPISKETDPEIGVDVWTIGTPKSVELGQSVSKGVLSGIRKANGMNYLQTDVSINAGNSGGALITKDGTIVGIVTAKLVGIGTEGVGFAIPASEVFKKLGLQYNP